MKKIILSVAIIGVISAAVIGFTIAYFNDTETSTGNIFTAGSIDLKVDHTLATYNGGECVGDCEETGGELIVNGGFEIPDVPTGGWAIYPDGSQTSWTVESGSGLEIQDNAAGAPHGGNQLAELDSYNPSEVSQMIPTVAGEQYRLTFWYSPRPNRPAGDNTIGVAVKVTSGNVTVINDIIGATSAGGANTSWTQYTYNFVATDSSTKIMFSDLGTDNAYGGYLDDISVKELVCSGHFPTGGVCTLWGEKDLGAGDTFWNFDDIKPGDHGTNVISLHPDNNDAWACLNIINKEDDENDLVDPETEAGDLTFGPTGNGELSHYLSTFIWWDTNQNGVFDSGEIGIDNGDFESVDGWALADSLHLPKLIGDQTVYLGFAWCAGRWASVPVAGQPFVCNGSEMYDDAQTDSFKADIEFYLEQWRNNPGFRCSNLRQDQ